MITFFCSNSGAHNPCWASCRCGAFIHIGAPQPRDFDTVRRALVKGRLSFTLPAFFTPAFPPAATALIPRRRWTGVAFGSGNVGNSVVNTTALIIRRVTVLSYPLLLEPIPDEDIYKISIYRYNFILTFFARIFGDDLCTSRRSSPHVKIETFVLRYFSCSSSLRSVYYIRLVPQMQ